MRLIGNVDKSGNAELNVINYWLVGVFANVIPMVLGIALLPVVNDLSSLTGFGPFKFNLHLPFTVFFVLYVLAALPIGVMVAELFGVGNILRRELQANIERGYTGFGCEDD